MLIVNTNITTNTVQNITNNLLFRSIIQFNSNNSIGLSIGL